jgi:hypothetical protein
MRSTTRHKTLKEQRYEFRQWRRWRRERVEELLAGLHGEAARDLLIMLRNMPSASALLNAVAAGSWRDADPDTRYEILALCDAAIIRHRERKGLAPIDDALPGQPDNVFLKLRELLFPLDSGATRGEARPNAA